MSAINILSNRRQPYDLGAASWPLTCLMLGRIVLEMRERVKSGFYD